MLVDMAPVVQFEVLGPMPYPSLFYDRISNSRRNRVGGGRRGLRGPSSSSSGFLSNVPSTVLAGNSDLLGAFRHLGCGLAVMNKSVMFFVAGQQIRVVGFVFLDISRDSF